MSHPETPSDPAPRRVELTTGPAAYVDEGTGPAVLAVHGLPGSVRDFRWLAPAVSSRLRFIRVDLPGFGDTPLQTEPGHTPESRARFLCRFMDALELERPIVLGHSMGGVYATQLAHQWPEKLRGLVLISSPGLRPHRGFRRVPAKSMTFLLRSTWLQRRLMPVLRRGFQVTGFRGPYSDAALLHTIFGVDAVDITAHATRIRAIHTPTMAVWTTNDPLIETEILSQLADAVPDGPRLIFEDGGHNPQKAYADQIAAALETWRTE